MVNTEEFTNRINKVMEYYDLSAASFADKIDVGRSSISHLLSGRNKPSLDFVMKIINAFPEVELYWLLNGKGTFPKKDSAAPVETKKPEVKKPADDLFTSTRDPENIPVPPPAQGKIIQKIVIFYSDGSFEAYQN
ncbi:helix-turn-helix transcriptional regulator [Salinimicrobium oceani]|uniref:Helix-turn-helix transcriptional regulator n=1 Tax=Salinimicrobium oceani TaxID=2722702 RepID=A0ABX1CYC7_9FLAO|nr:helix-turn-helix transcriptional regulator [Salinimicrobium oceani]NJW53262.1 helix-turn-helix transcriptional regulator [Salinimicrobium oceani]